MNDNDADENPPPRWVAPLGPAVGRFMAHLRVEGAARYLCGKEVRGQLRPAVLEDEDCLLCQGARESRR